MKLCLPDRRPKHGARSTEHGARGMGFHPQAFCFHVEKLFAPSPFCGTHRRLSHPHDGVPRCIACADCLVALPLRFDGLSSCRPSPRGRCIIRFLFRCSSAQSHLALALNAIRRVSIYQSARKRKDQTNREARFGRCEIEIWQQSRPILRTGDCAITIRPRRRWARRERSSACERETERQRGQCVQAIMAGRHGL